MITEIMATVDKGTLRPDGALPFPDQTRVRLRVQPVWNPAEAGSAWHALLARIDQRPILGGGGPYRREDLYERG